MTKIYIVMRNHSDYDDNASTLIAAFLDKDKAEQCVEEQDILSNKYKKALHDVEKHLENWSGKRDWLEFNLSYQEVWEFDTLANKGKRANKQEHKRLAVLRKKLFALAEERQKYIEARKEETECFVKTLNFLTEDEQHTIIKGMPIPVGAYHSVEEVELKD